MMRCVLLTQLLALAQGVLFQGGNSSSGLNDSYTMASAFGYERGAYSTNCSIAPNRRIILVTINSEYIDFFSNWLHHAQPFLTSSEMVMAVAEDQKAEQLLREIAAAEAKEKNFDGMMVMPAGDFPRVALLQQEQAWAFGSDGFGQLVTKRPDRLAKILDAGCSVLYVDIDTAWAQDPFREISKSGYHELYITDDTEKARGFTGRAWYFCSCFLYMHPTRTVKKLVLDWAHELIPKSRKTGQLEKGAKLTKSGTEDQPHLNNVLRKYLAKKKYADVAVMPYDKFPPGCRAKEFPDAVVFHANYRRGHDTKAEFLQARNLWKP